MTAVVHGVSDAPISDPLIFDNGIWGFSKASNAISNVRRIIGDKKKHLGQAEPKEPVVE